MTAKEIVQLWVEAFNRKDVEGLTRLYHEDAINHQVANDPVRGKQAIKQMFAQDFDQAEMVCIVENLFQDGEWAILEWKDTLGLKGCGFFHILDNKIIFQRGYWDKLTFLRLRELNQ